MEGKEALERSGRGVGKLIFLPGFGMESKDASGEPRMANSGSSLGGQKPPEEGVVEAGAGMVSIEQGPSTANFGSSLGGHKPLGEGVVEAGAGMVSFKQGSVSANVAHLPHEDRGGGLMIRDVGMGPSGDLEELAHWMREEGANASTNANNGELVDLGGAFCMDPEKPFLGGDDPFLSCLIDAGLLDQVPADQSPASEYVLPPGDLHAGALLDSMASNYVLPAGDPAGLLDAMGYVPPPENLRPGASLDAMGDTLNGAGIPVDAAIDVAMGGSGVGAESGGESAGGGSDNNQEAIRSNGRKRILEDREAGVSGSREKRARKVNLQVADWALEANTYLRLGISDESWLKCVDLWFELEKSTFDKNSRLTEISLCPAELGKWVSSRKKWDTAPVVTDLPAFAMQWMVWWTAMQPACRRREGEELPVPLEAEMKKDLAGLRRAGHNGLVVLMVGLKWWAPLREVDGRWHTVVDDLAGCLTMFLK
ncbi:hypothetical protein EST38_g4450 [Candolleomyces aberdarensis]|uniref:Uncharacterized protein n=1 Tax=Candolleomyces aberdarensis TaxID=2316362 RepID=A0A4Q2DMJ6_9AGAR|nr:hypothetical protein EST38_g4450 [Candolleomyces aberdarensis]